ncbi:MAG TPA: hypothetical protein VKQ08_09170, partial [Cyclobacteriaceae bacterium]|nr:hypothetical protein [Cyclobacteriaceae bacterium]
MRKIILFAAFAGVSIASSAQVINVKKTLGNAVVNQTDNSIYNAANQGVNAMFSAPGKIFRKIKADRQNTPGNTPVISGAGNVNTPLNNNPETNSPGSSISKAMNGDFVAGTEVLLSDNFSSTKPGEFPANWLTNSSGEVRTIDGQDGQWLQISANGIFALDQRTDLPENFTMEYDAIFHPTPSRDVHYIFYLYSVKDKVTDFKETSYPGNAGIYFAFNTAAGEVDAENFENGKPGIIDSHVTTDLLKSELTNKIHVGI